MKKFVLTLVLFLGASAAFAGDDRSDSPLEGWGLLQKTLERIREERRLIEAAQAVEEVAGAEEDAARNVMPLSPPRLTRASRGIRGLGRFQD